MQRDHFSSFNQAKHSFKALLLLPTSFLKLPLPEIFSKLNLSFIRRIEYVEGHVSVKRSGEQGGLALILALRWKDTLFMLCYITAMTFNGNKIINNTIVRMIKMTMVTKGVILNFLSVAVSSN